MTESTTDHSILKKIEGLVHEEQHLYGKGDLTDRDRGMLNSAFFWSYALLQIPAGFVVDRFGVKVPVAVGFLFWCMISAATAGANVIWQLLGLRLLLGVGESVITPDGVWRGRYEGKRVTGHWSIKNGRLCLSFPTNPNSECWTVIRNRDGTRQLFTVEGVPAGYLEVVRDNPNKF